jgi:hypothetical protein
LQVNRASRHIRALAQAVIDARQKLVQSRVDIAKLTHRPQFGLLQLEGEYRNSERTCRQRIYEVHQFSEQFLGSVVEVPPPDEFREHVVPSAAESSAQILRTVRKQVLSTREPLPSPVITARATYLLTFFFFLKSTQSTPC